MKISVVYKPEVCFSDDPSRTAICTGEVTEADPVTGADPKRVDALVAARVEHRACGP